AMDYTFGVTSTHEDLLEGWEAYRAERNRMRRWARGALVALAFMWLGGAAGVLVTRVKPLDWWQPAIWLFLGLFLSWHFLVKPMLTKRRLLATNAPSQQVRIEMTESGIVVSLAGAGTYRRDWSELNRVIVGSKGLGLGFTD